MKVTNRTLERASGFSLSQIRRWAVLCLGRDPEADKSGGRRREYDIDEAFLIFLTGTLITHYRFGQNEVKTHLNNLKPLLESDNLLPSKIRYKGLDYKDWDFMPNQLIMRAESYLKLKNRAMAPLRPGIDIIILPDNNYLLESYLRLFFFDEKLSMTDAVTFSITKRFPDENNIAKPGPYYRIPLYDLIVDFNQLIEWHSLHDKAIIKNGALDQNN